MRLVKLQGCSTLLDWLIGGGFPSRPMSDPWVGNWVGGCLGCVLTVAGLVGGRS